MKLKRVKKGTGKSLKRKPKTKKPTHPSKYPKKRTKMA